MKPIGVAIVGCGNIAGRHAQCVADIEEAALVAVCDQVPERARELAEKHGCEATTDLDALLAREDVEAVVLCLPAGIHGEIGLRALEAGVHVLVEKPIDVDPERARRMVEVAEESGLKLSVVSQHRFHDDVLWLREVLESGKLGKVVLTSVFSLWRRGQPYYDDAPGRGRHDAADGGVLLNQAVHVIDLLLWLCGSARSVQARLATLTHEIAVEDTAEVIAELETGLATVVASTSVSPQPPERLEIRCELGTAVIAAGTLVEFAVDEGVEVGIPPSRREGAEAPDRLEVFRRQHRDFARAARENGSPLVRATEALGVIEFILGAYRSHAENRPVALTGAADYVLQPRPAAETSATPNQPLTTPG